MRLSLKTKAIVFLTITIIAISVTSTYLFVSAYSRSIKDNLIERGKALIYSLSKTAEDGIMGEDLNLIMKAHYIVQAEDVVMVQVYLTTWDAIDAYPIEELKSPPHSDAMKHFKNSNAVFYRNINNRFEFYSPVTFKPAAETAPVTIGYSRLILSADKMQSNLRKTIFTSIGVALLITFLSVASVNILAGRLIINPLLRLHRSMSLFKNDMPSGDLPVDSNDEIGDLTREFNAMSRLIKEKEEKLYESERRLQSIFERVEHAIFRIDGRGSVLETNTRFKEMFGEVKHFCDIFEDKYESYTCLSIVKGCHAIIQREDSAVSKNGSKLTVMLSLYPDFEDGKLKGSDGYIIDITEKKRLEKSLMHAQKMEAIGTLAGGIAHDFNNMLQAILGYASLIKMKLSPTDPLYKPVDIIDHSANRAADLTRQLLGFARGGKYLVRQINLNTIVENVFNIISMTFDRVIETKTLLDRGLWTVEADENQIEHVVLNLCLNARDAMSAGGVLQIETFNKEVAEGEFSYPPIKSGRYAVIKISDTGIGIPKDIQHRLFEPFFTTKPKGENTGMGLAMVYGVIKNHNGFIAVDSEVGKGSVFTIYLPSVEKQLKFEDVVTGAEATKKKRGTVLLVDDEEIVRAVGRSMLESLDYDVIEAYNGEEALKIYMDKRHDIDVVILDIVMPRMGGKETQKRLKEINPDVKVIVSSGYSIDETAQEMIDSGAVGFMQKPYNLSELSKQLRAVL